MINYITIFVLGVFLFSFFIWLNFRLRQIEAGQKDNTVLNTALNLLKQDIEAMRRKFDEGLKFSTQEIHRALENTSQAYARMAKELGTVEEIGREMRNLQDFLRSPKLRGNIGEQILQDLLEQILPKGTFELQYPFREGKIVDAIIKTKQGIIPIDSKFPMESFRRFSEVQNEDQKNLFQKDFVRDVKKHIDDIAKKYILPQEGTVDFAVMYVPSEAVYYEIMVNLEEILYYGYNKKVYFVSPNSFYYFLKVIMMALQGAKIEETARKVLEGLKAVQQESLKFGEELSTLTGHIDRAKTSSERVTNRFIKLTGKIDNLGLLEAEEKNKLPS